MVDFRENANLTRDDDWRYPHDELETSNVETRESVRPGDELNVPCARWSFAECAMSM